MIRRVEVAIIGAGIGGLVLADELAMRGHDVLVIDCAERPGGVMRSELRDGFLLEEGPFTVLARSPEFHRLIERLELKPIEVDAGAAPNRYVQYRRRLHRVPTSPPALATSSLLSLPGRVRLLKGAFRSRPRPSARDESVAEVVTRRIGREASERLAGPACVGIFAAEAEELSFDACFPAFADADRNERSVRAMVQASRRAGGGTRRMISFENGLGALPVALADRLGDRCRLACPVEAIEREPGLFKLVTAHGDLLAERLVVATGLDAARRLLRPIAPSLAESLGSFGASDLGVVHLAFPRTAVEHPLDGFGYLVPSAEPDVAPLLGVIWPASCFAGHAPEGHVLLRAMVGGTRWPDALEADDPTLVRRTISAMRPVLGLAAEPTWSEVTRWPGAAPIYAPGHLERLARVESLLDDQAALSLLGNWSGGLGVNDRVVQAMRLAERLDRSHRREVLPAC